MTTVTVYKYRYTDTNLGEPATAKRMATKEYIELVSGWPVEGSEIEIDAAKVDAQGKTAIDFIAG